MATKLSDKDLNFQLKQREIELQHQKQGLTETKPGNTDYKQLQQVIAATEKRIVELKTEQTTRAKANETAQAPSIIAELERKRRNAIDNNPNADVSKIDAQIKKVKASADAAATTAADGTTLADDKYSEFTLNNDGTVTNKEGKQGIFVDEKAANGDVTPKFYTSYASARDAFLKGYAAEGQIATLQQQLLSSGYIKKDSIPNGTWVKGLDDALAAHSFKVVSDVKYNGVKEPMNFLSFLGLKKTGSGSGSSKTFRVITTRGESKKMLDEYLTGLTGSGATDQEADSFYAQLHAAENKATSIVADGTTTGSVLNDADRIMIAAKVARYRLRNSDVDTILKSGTGSQVAIDIAELQKTAGRYGIDMTAAEALQRVAAGVGQKDYIAKQEERLKLIAKQMHPNLAAHIDAGGTVEDIADQYAYAKSKKLGVAVPKSTTDKDVMDAVTKGMSISDFNRAMQNTPAWRESEEAHNLTNDFVNTMLKTFGLVG